MPVEWKDVNTQLVAGVGATVATGFLAILYKPFGWLIGHVAKSFAEFVVGLISVASLYKRMTRLEEKTSDQLSVAIHQNNAVFEALSLKTARTNQAGTVIWATSHWISSVGVEANQTLQDAFDNSACDADRERVAVRRRDAIEYGRAWAVDYRLRASGKVARETGSPMRNDTKVIGWQIDVHVTETK